MRKGEPSTTKVSSQPLFISNIIPHIWVTNFDSTTAVERRRRDKINNWIVQLSKAIPDCNIDYTKTGQVSIADYKLLTGMDLYLFA